MRLWPQYKKEREGGKDLERVKVPGTAKRDRVGSTDIALSTHLSLPKIPEVRGPCNDALELREVLERETSQSRGIRRKNTDQLAIEMLERWHGGA